MIYVANQQHLLTWLSKRNYWNPTAKARAIANVDAIGNIHGVVAIDNWNGVSCDMHMAGTAPWLSREVLRTCFEYVFNTLGCRKVIVFLVQPDDERLILEERIGFKVEHTIKDAAPRGDFVIITMDKEDCPWLEN